MSYIARLHQVVDELASTVAAKHTLACKEGCSGCCVDGLTVFEIEAARIREAHPDLLATGTPSDVGCAFLDEAGACRVYDVRPYVCRTQGLPLRWVEEEDGEAVEMRDICPLNANVDLAQIGPEAMWTIGPFEERLAQHGDTRVALRSLFASGKTRLPVIP